MPLNSQRKYTDTLKHKTENEARLMLEITGRIQFSSVRKKISGEQTIAATQAVSSLST
jgi:hypothetical protein